MAKFCGKCGGRLDPETGLCPKCDAQRIEKLHAGLSKEEDKQEQKKSNSARKKKKPKKIFRKIFAVLLLILACAAAVCAALLHFHIIEIPAYLYLNESAKQKDYSPENYNYIPSEKEISVDDKTGLLYANNEILVIFKDSATEQEKNEVTEYLSGKMVGSVAELGMYQIQIKGVHSLEELKSLANDVMNRFEKVLYATYDLATKNADAAYAPNDPWTEDVDANDWLDDTIDGTNWGLEAIDAANAWSYNDALSEITIGICDTSFDVGHEDLKNKVAFPNEVLKKRNITKPWWTSWKNLKDWDRWNVRVQENYHGTHVAGIIGAESDNGKGITGIVKNSKLLLAPSYEKQSTGETVMLNSTIYANLAYLVKAGSRVINFSLGDTGDLSEKHPAFDQEIVEQKGNLAASMIAQLLKGGYRNFIVVQSAGNGTGDTGKPVDAVQNGLFASITDSSVTGYDEISIREVRDHVIIVGAVAQTDSGFQCADFSNYGPQVSAWAPGTNIYSTIPGEIGYFQFFGGYGNANGTSMAAPMVTGICALAWSANPELSAKQVKEIVCSNTKYKVEPDPNVADEKECAMVNAELAVKAAIETRQAAEQKKNQEGETAVTHSQEREIVLALDTSGSMAGEPIEETCKASENFINTILKEEASIGIVTYDTHAYRVSDFSTDQDALNNEIMNIGAGGGTNISSGLQEAYSMLSEGNAKKKIIVLMSDGLPNDGMSEEDLVDYADSIKQTGVRIYTLGFFEKLSDYEKSGAQDLMERIASDGCHYEVENADDLVFFFNDMADQINGQKYIYVRIACPVDVQVTYQGQTLSSAEDEQSLRTDFGTLTFEQNRDAEDSQSDERIKVLRLKEGADYDLQIVGTGRGLMNYTIGFMDEDGNYSDLRKFEDVKITKKTVIDTVAAVSNQSVLNIDQDGDGRYDLKLCAEQNGYGKEMKPNYSVLILIGGSAIFIVGFIVIIVAKKKKG